MNMPADVGQAVQHRIPYAQHMIPFAQGFGGGGGGGGSSSSSSSSSHGGGGGEFQYAMNADLYTMASHRSRKRQPDGTDRSGNALVTGVDQGGYGYLVDRGAHGVGGSSWGGGAAAHTEPKPWDAKRTKPYYAGET